MNFARSVVGLTVPFAVALIAGASALPIVTVHADLCGKNGCISLCCAASTEPGRTERDVDLAPFSGAPTGPLLSAPL